MQVPVMPSVLTNIDSNINPIMHLAKHSFFKYLLKNNPHLPTHTYIAVLRDKNHTRRLYKFNRNTLATRQIVLPLTNRSGIEEEVSLGSQFQLHSDGTLQPKLEVDLSSSRELKFVLATRDVTLQVLGGKNATIVERRNLSCTLSDGITFGMICTLLTPTAASSLKKQISA
jgi:hypothetical protein